MSRITASHILVETEHEAQDLVKKLGEGKFFRERLEGFSFSEFFH